VADALYKYGQQDAAIQLLQNMLKEVRKYRHIALQEGAFDLTFAQNEDNLDALLLYGIAARDRGKKEDALRIFLRILVVRSGMHISGRSLVVVAAVD
jgi:tetratricopeptide (TPR) repeat protein